jgi:MFS family permease
MNDTATDSGIFAPERRMLTVGILLAVAVFAIEGMGVVPALPAAVRALHGLPIYGWVFAGFMLAWLLGTVAAGLLSDARGPRLPMGIGLGLFALGLFVGGAAQSMVQLLVGRVLQGIGGGAMVAAAFVAVARGYPDHLRARMMAITASVWILPALVGPAASGAISDWVGWRYVFFGIAPLCALTAVAVMPPLRALDVKQPQAGGKRMVDALRTATGGALLLLTADLWKSQPIPAGVCLLVGAVLFVPGLRALLPRGTFLAKRGLPAGLATRALLTFAFYGTEAFIPLASGELRHVSATKAGLALTMAAFGWIGASWGLDRIEAKAGASRRGIAVSGGFLLMAVGIAIVGGILLSNAPFWLLLLGWGISGAGIGFSYSAGSLLCFADAPKGEEGEVSGQLQIAEAVSTAAGTGMGGALLAGLEGAGFSTAKAHAGVFIVTLAIAIFGIAVARRSVHPASVRPQS